MKKKEEKKSISYSGNTVWLLTSIALFKTKMSSEWRGKNSSECPIPDTIVLVLINQWAHGFLFISTTTILIFLTLSSFARRYTIYNSFKSFDKWQTNKSHHKGNGWANNNTHLRSMNDKFLFVSNFRSNFATIIYSFLIKWIQAILWNTWICVFK